MSKVITPTLTWGQALHSCYLGKLEKEQVYENYEAAGVASDPDYHSKKIQGKKKTEYYTKKLAQNSNCGGRLQTG